MTGFKQGASDDDPLGGEDGTEEVDDEDEIAEEVESPALEEQNSSFEDSSNAPTGLPWIYERSGITDGREKTVQLHLQQQTIDGERELVAALEQTLGESVNKADAREAAYLIAMNHVDEVADQLREWGYDHQ